MDAGTQPCHPSCQSWKNQVRTPWGSTTWERLTRTCGRGGGRTRKQTPACHSLTMGIPKAEPMEGRPGAGCWHPGLYPDRPFPFTLQQPGGGRQAPAIIPAHPAVILAPAVARERGRRKQDRDCWGQSSRWKSPGQLCTAPQEPGIQGGSENIRRRKMSHGNSEASRPVSWAGRKGRRSCPVGWLLLPCPRASGPLPGQEPWAPIRLRPGGRVQTGAIREGGWWGRGRAQSP